MKPLDPTSKLCKLRKYVADYVSDYITLVTSDKPCLCKKCGRIGPDQNICAPKAMDRIHFSTRNVDLETPGNGTQ